MKITKPFAIIQDCSYFVGQRLEGGDMEIKEVLHIAFISVRLKVQIKVSSHMSHIIIHVGQTEFRKSK